MELRLLWRENRGDSIAPAFLSSGTERPSGSTQNACERRVRPAVARLFPVVIVLCLIAPNLPAQDRKILSPRDSVLLALDTNVIAVSYSRPSMRGRKIMGELVPWDRVWRTGANQATHIRTTFDMMLGGMPVPRGVYTLWTLPSPSGWKMIINKQTGQWGTQYDERQDLARMKVTSRRLPAPVDTFTVKLRKTGKSSGILTLMWEFTSVEVPFSKESRMGLLSPPDSASIRLNGKRIVVRYGSPGQRGRTIWGVVVPWDTVWRTGANLATSFETGVDVTIGTIKVPKGSYSLYSVPNPDFFTLIINKAPGGSPPQYDAARDLGRTAMNAELSQRPIDPFRIWFQARGSRRAVLNLGWADRVYSVDLTVP